MKMLRPILPGLLILLGLSWALYCSRLEGVSNADLASDRASADLIAGQPYNIVWVVLGVLAIAAGVVLYVKLWRDSR